MDVVLLAQFDAFPRSLHPSNHIVTFRGRTISLVGEALGSSAAFGFMSIRSLLLCHWLAFYIFMGKKDCRNIIFITFPRKNFHCTAHRQSDLFFKAYFLRDADYIDIKDKAYECGRFSCFIFFFH